MRALIAPSVVSLTHTIVHSALRLILVQCVASVSLIAVVDWRSRNRTRRTESSIRALEALFALPDLRETEDSSKTGPITLREGSKPIAPS